MRARLAAAATTAALAAAGCGGSGPPSLAQLRAQGTRVCSSAGKKIDRIRSATTTTGAERFLNRGIAVLRVELRALERLSAPGDASSVYRSALTALSKELTALEHAVAALGHQQDPATTFSALQRRLGPLEKQADDAWQALQMPACMDRR